VSARSVGIFDSGVGGLSVAREIRRALPAEDLVYVADTAYCPYGDRPEEEIVARSLAIGHHLEAAGAKVLVVACNTASGAALEILRERLSIPVVGMEPALKPAVRLSSSGRVGVMATSGTLRSARFARLVESYADGAEVHAEACPGLVDLVEDGVLEGPELEARLAELTAPLRSAGVDTVVLGCTHYPFVRDAIARMLGSRVRLLDSGEAIARRTRQILAEAGELEAEREGTFRFCTTGRVEEVAPVVSRLWPGPALVEHLDV
jgi:glutamate racemase